MESKEIINTFIKNKNMKKETKFVSLFEYLGYAAGGDLGKEVYAKAKQTKQPTQQRVVENKSYTGKVMLYTESFLDSYFINTTLDDELPFELPF